MILPQPGQTAADYFGTKTGTHTHPATHPSWMTFPDDNCVVCGTAH